MSSMMQDVMLKYVEHINQMRHSYDMKLQDTEQNLGKEFSCRLD